MPGTKPASNSIGTPIEQLIEKSNQNIYPIEYNIYALSLKTEGAIEYFYLNLDPQLVGLPTGNTGLHELYLAFLDFYKQTGLSRIDSIAFQSWLNEQGVGFVAALGGEGVISQYLDTFEDIPLSTPEAVTTILKHRANKRKQLNALQELQLLVNSKDVKTTDDRAKLLMLTEQIRDLEKEIGYDPLSKVTTAVDIANHANDLWELPNFITTPFKELNKALSYTAEGGVCRAGVTVIAAPSGKGKGHPLHTKILTPHGWVALGDLIIGDEVIGSDGRATKVTGVYDRGILPTYRIIFSDGSHTTCDGDHLWAVSSHSFKDRTKRVNIDTKTLYASNLREGKTGTYKYKIPLVQPVEFKPIDLPVDPYFLGIVLANGYLVNHPIIRTNDEYVIKRILTNGVFHVQECTYDNSTARGFSIYNFREALRNLELYGKKSADKFIPKAYLIASIEDRQELLSALLDCDGCVRHDGNRGQALYCTRSHQLALNVQELAESLGMTTAIIRTLDKIDQKYDYTVHLNSQVNPFQTPTKKALFKASRIQSRTIRSVERVEDEYIRCISVDADDSLYVTERYIVTHNSTLVKCLTNYWVDNGYSVLYINFEEAKDHWERILMTQIIKKNVYSGCSVLERKQYTEIFQKKLLEWGDRLMVLHDPETSYFDDLELWLRDIIAHKNHMPDVVVIDTIQSLQTKGQGKPRWGEYEMMMIRLEKLAKDMDCAIIITAQENLQRLKDKREVAEQYDIGGSITLVQKSTATIVITQKRTLPGQETEDESIVQLQIPKNRITGTAFIDDPPLLRYNDETKSFEEYALAPQADYVEWNLDQVGL